MIRYAMYKQDSDGWWHILFPGEAGGKPPHYLSFCDGVCMPKHINIIQTDNIIPSLKLCPECLSTIKRTEERDIITADDWWMKKWDALSDEDKRRWEEYRAEEERRFQEERNAK